MSVALRPVLAGLAATFSVLASGPLEAAQQPPVPPRVTFADLADRADSAQLVIHAKVLKTVRVANERAPGVKPGFGRFYVEAQTLGLLAGNSGIGASLRYLVDLPLDARGKGPNLKKVDVVLFARTVVGRPGEVQLVSPDSQLLWTPALDSRLRELLRQMVAPDAPATITGVRELLYVPGNLAGQGETQIFLKTKDGSAASITVRHEPGQGDVWGASFSELVADVTRPPEPDTLEWYRLACFLPQYPPAASNVSEDYEAKRRAQEDYRFVLSKLGPCERTHD